MTPIYLDANILIDAFESTSEDSGFIWSVLKAIEAGGLIGNTSQIILAELLPKPLAKKQFDLVQVYGNLLSAKSILSVQPVTPETLSSAARIRAERLCIKLPDAIHIATALRAGCPCILTNDKRLDTPTGPIIVKPGPNCLKHIQALVP